MSVQYKSSDGWKNISSSSNNAVDTVENGNMNPVTSNAVYDALKDGTFNIKARTVVSNGLPNDLHEGGEFELARPDGSTYKSLGKLYIDSYDNKMRFFGTNSSNTTTMFEIDFTDNKIRFNGVDVMSTPVNITPIANSTYLTIISSNIQQTGKIVTVSVFGTLKAGTNNGAAIINGLPISTTGNNSNGIETSLFMGSNIRPAYLNGAGSLVAWYTISENTDVRINFTYTAK